MDRREIEVFVTVMQLGSVSAAARLLNMAQPSVSKAIAMIERRHGISLFERHKGRLTPTEAARQLLGEASRLEAELSRFDRYVDTIRQMRPGLIRVAATPSLSLGLLPVLARLYRERHGDQGFIFDMHPNHDITAAVERGQYDLGLMVQAGADPLPGTLKIAGGHIICIMPEDHPLAAHAEIGAGDISGQDLVAITTDRDIVAMLMRNVPGFDRRSSRSLETNRYNIAVNLVRQGLGMTLVDGFTTFDLPKEGLAWRPVTPSMEVSLLAAIGETTAQRPEMRALLDILGGLEFGTAG
ncbi:LysR family transcriptional regulator (plasmid) [Thioclava sp. 'Guangxiensis']|uniref:LysR family transcriptional regulator n=1 Tax=Thioclava sp. 'Guangxiensis' TaxID=3149044 RepID=UPI0032C44045